MKKILCLLMLALAAVAYAGDKPIQWKHAPGGHNTSTATSGSISLDADIGGTSIFTGATTTLAIDTGGDWDWTPSYQPNVTMAPAAVRFERGKAICPHCQNEYDTSAGYHTIVMNGSNSKFETCVDSIITLLNNNRAGEYISIDEDE